MACAARVDFAKPCSLNKSSDACSAGVTREEGVSPATPVRRWAAKCGVGSARCKPCWGVV